MRALRHAGLIVAAALLAACSKGEEAEQAPLPPRPVLTMIAAERPLAGQTYSGQIAPRFETTLAFRTLGRIVSRNADVGDQVEKGQVLAAIDAEALAADVRSARAELADARIQARAAEASAVRSRTLFAENTVSQSELEIAEQSRQVAVSQVRSAQAQLDKAENRLGFAVLTAPYGGVITERMADVGEVVSAGATVFRLARTDEREAVVDVPASQSAGLAEGDPFEVRLQIRPDLRVEGTIREIAPEADALTRTNRVRITLADPPPAYRIGALITAVPAGGEGTGAAILLPESAILEEDGQRFVFVVAADEKSVEKRPVAVAPAAFDAVRITDGLNPDERIVIAGVRSLTDNQPISLLEEPEGATAEETPS
ncbi:efflux RND transporter periplasmic adaptor subunit [Fulvimarina sp. 2208YS6-2-32]|uniref:Efflux RND transporter periplasmic adaptor subunit n=1 Tax=Fulvimarina uroteuthidis TaxID=3098149 RepID=A0ABU5I891_9HYPH|nr:efflux RND transporter periplasmic adaptor subunit [Fulvimarina sp. 2208YS6-2-32]MDY8111114.1 efflux RND transporter periplasmic adaptor subunit [Fulvimarina sp. 2208YS6-2-32]